MYFITIIVFAIFLTAVIGISVYSAYKESIQKKLKCYFEKDYKICE